MKRQFFLLSSIISLLWLNPAQAQFTIEANVTGTWKTIAGNDLEPDQAEAVFGPVDTGIVIDRDFRFTNNTGDTVAISGVTFEDSAFTAILTETEIKSGESKNFTIRYTAGAASVDPVCEVVNDSPGDTASYTFRLLGLVTPPPPQNSYTVSGRLYREDSYEDINSGDNTPSLSDGTRFTSPDSSILSHSFKITNTGEGSITFTGRSFTGAQASEFSTTGLPDFPFTVEPGAEEAFNMSWNPVTVSESEATFELLSDLSPDPFIFSLSGMTTPQIQVADITEYNNRLSENSLIGYGLVHLGTQSLRTFTIKNTGFDTLFITSITSDNPKFDVDHDIVSVALGETKEFTIVFEPTTVTREEALITIESNAPGDAETYTFRAEAFGESDVGGPEIIVTSTVLGIDIAQRAPGIGILGNRFEKVAIGNSATFDYTISNIGDSPLAITGITLDEPDHFSVPDINTTVPAGGEMTFTLTFQPTSVGYHDTTVTIVNDDPDAGERGTESPYQLRISGHGVVDAPDIVARIEGRGRIPLGAAPSVPLGTLAPTVPFDPDLSGRDRFSFPLVIENEGNAPLSIAGLRRSDGFNASFTTRHIDPGNSVRITISGTVTEPGTYHSSCILISDDGDERFYTFDLQITLTGDGELGARILSITSNGADIDLDIELPAASSYFIDESEDLSTWSPTSLSSFIGQQGTQMRTLPGRATPPASGQRFFRPRLEE